MFHFALLPLRIYHCVLRKLPIPHLLVAALASNLVLLGNSGSPSAELFSLANLSHYLCAFIVQDALWLAAVGVAVRHLPAIY